MEIEKYVEKMEEEEFIKVEKQVFAMTAFLEKNQKYVEIFQIGASVASDLASIGSDMAD